MYVQVAYRSRSSRRGCLGPFVLRAFRPRSQLVAARGDAENAESRPALSLQCVFFFFFFLAISCYSQSGDDPQQDLAKFGYKKNMKVKI